MAKKTLWKVFGADIIVNLKYLYPVKVMDDLFPHNSYMRNSAKRSGKKEVTMMTFKCTHKLSRVMCFAYTFDIV